MSDQTIEALGQEIKNTKEAVHLLGTAIGNTQNDLNFLTEQLNQLLNHEDLRELPIIDTSWLPKFQETLEQHIEVPEILTKAKRLPKLSHEDVVAGCLCGFLAAAADIFLVGTPQIKNNVLTGAPINELLRKIDGDSGIWKWLSIHCKVPYDKSAVTNTVCPLNHRLRNIAHDPLFGALFALLDIVMGTTTCVNNAGKLVMLPNPKGTRNGWLFLVYYFGHLLSDVFTYCGLPVPGWFLTQFFSSEDDRSLSKIAEDMYKNGFDFRQEIGMITSAQIGIKLTNFYCLLAHPIQITGIGAEAEIQHLQKKILHREIRLLTSSIAASGNVLKIMLPPACGDLAGINLPQWRDFAWNGILTIKAATRDMSVENVVYTRKNINDRWKNLMEDI